MHACMWRAPESETISFVRSFALLAIILSQQPRELPGLQSTMFLQRASLLAATVFKKTRPRGFGLSWRAVFSAFLYACIP